MPQKSSVARVLREGGGETASIASMWSSTDESAPYAVPEVSLTAELVLAASRGRVSSSCRSRAGVEGSDRGIMPSRSEAPSFSLRLWYQSCERAVVCDKLSADVF